MEGLYRQIISLVTLALVLQIAVPFFASDLSGDYVSSEVATWHAEHHSVCIPLLIKETDETEDRLEDFVVQFVQLMDFTEHSFNLSHYHNKKTFLFSQQEQFAHSPPLFTLYNVFLI